jgi:hypothetical protein
VPWTLLLLQSQLMNQLSIQPVPSVAILTQLQVSEIPYLQQVAITPD